MNDIHTPEILEITSRPAAPADLTQDEANEWDEIVSSLACDWFKRETHGLLAQLCRHLVAARKIAILISETEPDDLAKLDKLFKMQERESRAIASLSTKMRLAQQSTIDSENKRKRVGRKPWEE